MTPYQIVMAVLMSLAILSALFCTAAICFVWWKVGMFGRRAAESSAAASDKMSGAVDRLEQSVKILAKASEDLPALERGLIRVCQDLVAALGDLKEQNESFSANVSKLYGSIFSKDSSSYQAYDEKAASREYEVQELVEKGVPRQEAEGRISQARVYSRKNMAL